jgi:hypothetical protein
MVFLLVASGAVFSGDLATQRFALPNHGVLKLSFPSSWHSQLRQPAGSLPPTIALTPTAGAPFQILITAIWAIPPRDPLPNHAAIHDQVAAAAKSAAPESVEGTVPLRDLRGPHNQGYYFLATDRAPKPGEFKYLTQGIVELGGINLAFTLLTNDGQDRVVKAALDMLRVAVQKSDGSV